MTRPAGRNWITCAPSGSASEVSGCSPVTGPGHRTPKALRHRPDPGRLRQSRPVPDLDVIPHSSRPIPAHRVLGLYQAQGWWPERTAEQVTAALNSGPAVGAWHGDQLVGFARAVT